MLESFVTPRAEAVVRRCLDHIERAYERSPGAAYRLPFHNRKHTVGVIERGMRIGAALGLAPDEQEVLQMLCAGHDLVQDFWEKKSEADGQKKRMRFVGRNERQSMELLLRFIDEAKGAPLSDRVLSIMGEAFIATVPAYDPETKTVYQPGLHPGVHLMTRALALADLGSAGMEPRDFMRDAVAMFLEDNIDVYEITTAALAGSPVNELTILGHFGRFMSWMHAERDFVYGREKRLPRELDGLSSDAKNAVAKLFSRFDETVALLDTVTAEYASLSNKRLYFRLWDDSFRA